MGPIDGRNLRSLRTRRSLEQAALRQFIRRGFDQTTIEDIAEAAGVSARTFFRHFPTKEDVLFGDQEELRRRLRESFTGRPRDEPTLRSVREALRVIAADYEEQRDDFLLRAQIGGSAPTVVARGAEYNQAWQADLTLLCAERLGADPATDPGPSLIAGATIAALATAVSLWMASGGRRQLPELLEECLNLLENGLGVDSESIRAAPRSKVRSVSSK